MLSSMCNNFYWHVYGDLFRLRYITNNSRLKIKPNWVLLKIKNHLPPVYISQYNKNYKKIIGYSTKFLNKGVKVNI